MRQRQTAPSLQSAFPDGGVDSGRGQDSTLTASSVRKRIVHRTVLETDSSPAKQAPRSSHISGTERFAKGGPYTYTHPMKTTLIGYARCSTDKQDLSAQRQALLELGVVEDRIYTDHGLTGTNRARPGLDQALAAVRDGDTLVVPIRSATSPKCSRFPGRPFIGL